MIYIKTSLGIAAIRDRRAVKLTLRQRAALILFEGSRTLEAILDATAPLGVTRSDIEALIAMRLLAPMMLSDPPRDATPPPDAEPDTGLVHNTERARRYRAAYTLATQLTASLGARAHGLLLDVEAAEGIDELTELLPRLRSLAGPQRVRRLQEALEGC